MPKSKQRKGGKASGKKRSGKPKPPVNGGWAVPRGGGAVRKSPPGPSTAAARGASHERHVRHACSVTDPFCQASKGQKYPDGQNGQSVGYQARGHVTLDGTLVTGGVVGDGIIYFSPSATFGYMGPGSLVGGVYNMGVFASYPNMGFVITNATTYRIVSFGIIARCMSSVTNAQGYLTFGTSTPLAANAAIPLGGNNYLEQIEVPVMAGMQHCWIAKPIGIEARRYLPIASASNQILVGGAGYPSWTGLVVEMRGGAGAATKIDFEFFMNIEFQLNAGNGLATLVPKDPPHNPIVTSATKAIVDKTSSFVEGGVKEVEDAIYNAASGFIGPLLKDGLSFLMGAL